MIGLFGTAALKALDAEQVKNKTLQLVILKYLGGTDLSGQLKSLSVESVRHFETT